MRSTRSWFASSSSRVLSRLAAVVLLTMFAVAPSWAGRITSITWNTYSGVNSSTTLWPQYANPVFHTDDPNFSGTAHIEVVDANEYPYPPISLAALGLPEYITVTGESTTYPWGTPPFIGLDDDNTPYTQEIGIHLLDVTGSVFSDGLDIIQPQGGGGCGCGHEDARVRLAQVDGTASPTAVTLRVLRETPLGGGISFAVGLPAETRARVDVFDISGRRLRTISNGVLPSGVTTLKWDGRDDAGERARPGIVFARLSTPKEVRSARLVLGPGIH